MAKARKLSDEEAQLLAEAEKAAKAGFNQQTKELNQEVYGSTDKHFDPTVEMKNFDPSNSDVAKEFGKQMSNPNFEEYAKTVEQPPYKPEDAPSEGEAAPDNVIPDDPEERLKWTARMLKEINPKAPDYNALKNWKQMHGSVFILNIQDKIYIYRYIKRQEWAQLQANDSFQNMTPIQQEDNIVERCVLWPQLGPIEKASMPAGATSMLAEQIRIQSMFLDPVQVANITLKL